MGTASLFDITNMLSCYDYLYCIGVIFIGRFWNQFSLVGLKGIFIYADVKQILLNKLLFGKFIIRVWHSQRFDGILSK